MQKEFARLKQVGDRWFLVLYSQSNGTASVSLEAVKQVSKKTDDNVLCDPKTLTLHYLAEAEFIELIVSYIDYEHLAEYADLHSTDDGRLFFCSFSLERDIAKDLYELFCQTEEIATSD